MTAGTFTAEGKALSTTELRSGDLELRGYAVVWEGLDAQNENFLRGSFRKAIPAFLKGGAPLAFHHQGDKVLGRVLEMEEDAYGVKLRARVDKQEATSPLRHLYDAIKRGTLKGLSTGGYFSRAQTAAGRMIDEVLRITEVSVTGVPQHPLTSAQAAEVKAIMRPNTIQRVEEELALLTLRARVLGISQERSRTQTLAERAALGML